MQRNYDRVQLFGTYTIKTVKYRQDNLTLVGIRILDILSADYTD